MTRNEEIEKAYEEWRDDIECSERTVWKEAAQWADEHPKNPWRDAKNELPKRDKRLDNHDTLNGCSKYVLTISEDGDIVVARYNTIKKLWCNFKTYITKPKLWMPIHELPKGGEE